VPKAEECVIGIDLATALRDFIDQLPVKVPKGDIGMRCLDCGKPVKPHAAGGGQAAHFEHLRRNKKCGKSHVARS
jgi:hypothetical protein